MEGAILSGQLAGKAVQDIDLGRGAEYDAPMQLQDRPFNGNAKFANEITEDRQLYRVRVAESLPQEVEAELKTMAGMEETVTDVTSPFYFSK